MQLLTKSYNRYAKQHLEVTPYKVKALKDFVRNLRLSIAGSYSISNAGLNSVI